MNYATQMEAARRNIITDQMKHVADYEGVDPEYIRSLVAKGQVVISANRNHKSLTPYGIGSMLKTKINVNLGTSRDCIESPGSR